MSAASVHPAKEPGNNARVDGPPQDVACEVSGSVDADEVATCEEGPWSEAVRRERIAEGAAKKWLATWRKAWPKAFPADFPVGRAPRPLACVDKAAGNGDVRALAWGRDGQLACGGEAGTVVVYGSSGRKLWSWPLSSGRCKAVNALCFGDRWLAIGREDGCIVVLGGKGEEIWEKPVHGKASVNAIAVSSKGHLASGGNDGTIVVFPSAVADWRDVVQKFVQKGKGKSHVTCSSTTHQWGASGPVEQWRSGAMSMGHVHTLAFSPSGNLAAGGDDGQVAMYKPGIACWKHMWSTGQAQGRHVQCMAFSCDGYLASGGHDGSIVVFSEAGEELHRIQRAHGAAASSVPHIVMALAFVPLDRYRMSSTKKSEDFVLVSGGNDGSIAVYSTVWEELHRIPDVHHGKQGTLALAATPRGHFASSGADGSVILYSVSGEQLRQFGTEKTPVRAVCPDGRLALYDSSKGSIVILDSDGGEVLTVPNAHPSKVHLLGFMPSGYVSMWEDGRVAVYSEAGTLAWEAKEAAVPRTFAVASDGRLALVAGQNEHSITVYGADGLKPVLLDSSLGGSRGKDAQVTAIAFALDGCLLVGGTDGYIVSYGTNGKASPPLAGHGGKPVHALAFAPCGQLASGGEDGTIQIHGEAGDAQHIEHAHRGGRGVSCLVFVDAGCLASSGDDKFVRVWRTSGELLATFPFDYRFSYLQLVSCCPLCDTRLAVGQTNGVVAIIALTEFPLALAWKRLTTMVESEPQACAELLKQHPRVPAQPLPVLGYTLLHYFVQKRRVQAVTFLCNHCVETQVWAGLNRTLEGKNVLDLAGETRDIAMIRVVMAYLCRTPARTTDSADWTRSVFRIFCSHPHQAIGLPTFLDSRLVQPGSRDGDAGTLPVCAAGGTILRVHGSHSSSLSLSEYEHTIAPAGDVPIALRALRLPYFEVEWMSPELLNALHRASDATIASTPFQALVKRAWAAFGWKEHLKTGAIICLDLLAFTCFSVLTAQSAASKNLPPALDEPWASTLRWAGGFLLTFFAARNLVARFLFPSKDRWEHVPLLVGAISVMRLCGGLAILSGVAQPLWLGPMLQLRNLRVEVHTMSIQVGAHGLWGGLRGYFMDPWNTVDMLSLSLAICIQAGVLLGAVDPETATPMMSLATLPMWCKNLYFLRAYRAFGNMIQIMISTLGTMVHFVLIMMILLMGLAHAWALLGIAHDGAQFLQEEDVLRCEEESGELQCESAPQNFHHWVWAMVAAFFVIYRLVLVGDFEGDAFALADFSGIPGDEPGMATVWISWLIFIIGTLLFLVLLLNLLIAIISNKYDELKQNAEITFWRERAMICLEAYMNMKRLPQTYRYLIMSFPKWTLHDDQAEDTCVGGMANHLEVNLATGKAQAIDVGQHCMELEESFCRLQWQVDVLSKQGEQVTAELAKQREEAAEQHTGVCKQLAELALQLERVGCVLEAARKRRLEKSKKPTLAAEALQGEQVPLAAA